jgi:hypothetical protein
MYFKTEPTIAQLKRCVINCYVIAKRNRMVIHKFEYSENGESIDKPIGPRSDDPEWDHIIRFCEELGLTPSILRLAETENSHI